MKTVKFFYLRTTCDLEVPDDTPVLVSDVDRLASDRDGISIVKEAMASPIDSPRLRDLAKGKPDCVIIISDHTRPVPSRDILPPMIGELREGKKTESNRLLRIKRILMLPTRLFPGRKFARRMSLALGNAICCPSVTYLKSVTGENPFQDTYKSNLDWELTEKLSRRKGSFVYNPRIRMHHRIHGGSTTTEIIGDSLRTKEDFEMMKKFWPEGIARRLSRAYAASEKSNET